MKTVENIDGGITAAKGFSASGVHAGIKKKNADMALVVSDLPATAAGVFTSNAVQAAPVRLCRERIGRDSARAILVNSGCANACTGPAGMDDARKMAKLAADRLGVDEMDVFVCSTGTIGTFLPMDKIAAGTAAAAEALSPDGGNDAARAIMTTDTVDKQEAVELEAGGARIRIGGMTKGAGMIEPNMATMLGFLSTDAAVTPAALQACLRTAVDASFNRISVDGDQSTNDTVLLLANGAAGGRTLDEKDPDWEAFASAVREVATRLAMRIVRDGEGATRFVTVTVKGAVSAEDARKAARAIANSLLVKTSWYGGDPNWGRVMDAVGYSGAAMREEDVEILYDDLCAVRNGLANPDIGESELAAVLAGKEFTVTVDLHGGDGVDTVYTCDCSEEYVKINSEYMT